MRIALMLVLCGSGLLLIAVHFALPPWPTPRSCRALICDPVCCQLLPVGVGFVVPGLRVPVAVRRARMRGLMLPGRLRRIAGRRRRPVVTSIVMPAARRIRVS